MQITTDRLILREFVEADWPAVLVYQRDPRYLRYTHWADRTPQEVQQFVQMFIAQQYAQPRIKFQLAVELKETQHLIGNCGIRLKSAGATEADIGYELAPDQWDHGYATEAAQAIVEFGFTELKLHRISAWCIAENTASSHVLEKLGLKLEGRLRETEHFKNRWWDTLLYAMLKEEWHA
jgi:[ribosomal protein S5]-alanine N-acetyltransferase